MNNKKPIILVDGNNIAHRAYHANSGLSYKGKSVAVIYGVINIIRSLVNTEKPKKVIVVWDGGRNRERLKVYPEYKGQRAIRREKNDFDWEDWNRQIAFTRKMIKNLGIAQVWKKGMEADDYIYMLVDKYTGKRPIKILSNDKDFHQLLSTGYVSQLVNKKEFGGENELTQNTFESVMGMTPTQYIDYLILTGDDSDNIKGFGGIGPVKAKKFISDNDSITECLHQNNGTKEFLAKLESVYNINRVLIDLELFYTKFLRGKVKLEYLFENPKPSPNINRFNELCQRYNLRTFQKASFTKPFL